MEKNQKNQPPHASGRGPKDPDRKNSPLHSKTSGTGPQKPTAAEEDNARMRFENEYEQTDDKKKEESDRKPGTNQLPNSNQNYTSNIPNSNEGLNPGSKQSREQITNQGINQDTESINK